MTKHLRVSSGVATPPYVIMNHFINLYTPYKEAETMYNANAVCLRLEVAFQAPIGHELDDHQYWLAGSHDSEETHYVRMLELCQHVGLTQKILTGALRCSFYRSPSAQYS